MFSLLSALASMGPYFAPSLAALACCLLPADCCLMCNSEVVAALKSLKTDFLPNFMNPSEVNHTYEWIVRTVKGFSDLPYNKNSYVGAVDEKTYNIVIKSFLKSLKNVTDSRIKGKQNFEKLKEMLRNEKVNFAFHAAQFQRLVHCRNKCGEMMQHLIWCDYCNFQIHTCKKPVDCGGRHLEIHEAEELNLNCHLDWHDNAYALASYTFYRVWENNSETVLYQGKDPVLNKPSVTLKDAGNYRCVLGNTFFPNPTSIVRFHVTVFPRNIEEWKPSGEFAPSEPNKEEEEEEETPSPTEAEPIVTQPFELQNMLQGRINGLVICFAIILIVAFIFWLLTRKKKKTKQKSSRASIDSKGSKTSKRRSSKAQKK